MKKCILLLFLIIFESKNFAQKRELGNVTVEELAQKSNPKDTAAVATMLFNKGKTYFEYSQEDGFYILTDVEVKLKIYKKEGYSWANFEVPFYIGDNVRESVSFSKAITYNLVDGKIEKTKLKSENEFSEDKNKLWASKKIVMPAVKEGSIVEFKYSIKSPYLSKFPDWKFQKLIPVNYSEYSVAIPEYYVYNTYRKGFLQPIESKTYSENSFQVSSKDLVHSGVAIKYQRSNSSVTYKVTQSNYVLENVPALKEEVFVNNIDNYTTSIEHELSEKRLPKAIVEFFSLTWEDVAKKINESEYFGSQLEKNNYFETEITTLIQGISSKEEKAAAIYNFVKSRMNWNGYYNIYTDLGVKKAYEEKTGNIADINLMLVSMLRFAEIDANPVLISTRSHGIPLFPSRTAFNCVIAAIEIEGNLYLLDATNKNALPNILPFRDLNWSGRILKKEGVSEIIDVMPTFNSNEVVNMLLSIDEKGIVSGQVRQQYFDYNALRFRENHNGVSTNSIVESMEKENKGLEVENYEVVNDKNYNEPVIEKYAIKNSNEVEIIGSKLYFSPLIHMAMSENPFKQETREYPIDFSYPFKDKYTISIKIPEGFQVESLPKATTIALDKNYGSFSYTATNTDTQVQVVVTFNINASIIPAEDYAILKDFFKAVADKENEKVILKKL